MSSTTVYEWLCHEERGVLREAVRDPYVAMGVYRHLGDEAHAVILQVLSCEVGTPLHATAAVMFEKNRTALEHAVQLGLFYQKTEGWVLYDPFHAALVEGLQTGGAYSVKKVGTRLRQGGAPVPAEADLVGRDDGYTQWSSVLRVLLPTQQPAASEERLRTSEHNTKTLQMMFTKAGYRRDAAPSSDSLTAEGFRFLMSSAPRQVFAMIRTWMQVCIGQATDAKSFDMKLRVTLFVMSLPFHQEGVWYPNFMSKASQSLLPTFALFGIVVHSKSRDEYKVTPLGRLLGLPQGPHTARKREVRDGSLIVETNNRVYAYTNDAFRVGMLTLFAAVELRAEGMTVARLTRDSLQAAFQKKITGDQIIDYLRANAHPEMAFLPDTVVDQILLWESEINRVQFTPAVLVRSPQPATIQHVRSAALGIHPEAVLHAQQKVLVIAPDVHRQLQRSG